MLPVYQPAGHQLCKWARLAAAYGSLQLLFIWRRRAEPSSSRAPSSIEMEAGSGTTGVRDASKLIAPLAFRAPRSMYAPIVSAEFFEPVEPFVVPENGVVWNVRIDPISCAWPNLTVSVHA